MVPDVSLDGRRRARRPKVGALHGTTIWLSDGIKDKVYHAATRRGLGYGELLARIVTTVFDEGLLGAVLDDEGEF